MTKTRSINLCHSRQVEMVTIESAVHAEVIYFLLLDSSILIFSIYIVRYISEISFVHLTIP